MSIRVYLHTSNKRAETPALLDSGATENFINHRYATHMRLPVKKLPTPRKVFNVDGTPNKKGDIQFYTDLEVRTGQKNTNMRFFLTDLGPQRMILGYPWFAAVQPKIDWAKGWIDYAQLPVVIKTTNARRTQFTRAVKTCGRRMKLRVATQTKASQLAEQNQTRTTPQLPTEYRRHAQVFSEQKAQRFPESRPWDHAIELKKDAPSTLPGKIYSLTQSEQKALQEFIKEHLQKGYIRPSKSPYAAPFFFIKKKDRKLRPIQDYRQINEWTIKNRYPLPLIPELINRVKGATLFSKFDVRWGYNNVRIKKGDEWKVAFITNQGLFEPRVMFFGLTNSPATFQTMMNEIFQEELREGWVSIYMDDILIHTDSNLPRHRKCVHQILDKLKKHDLYLKPEKCLFEQEEMEFLGVVLKNGTIQMDPTKIKGVADWPKPNNVRDIRAFLGFTGFYRYFIPNYSKIARPLIDLTRKATPFHWEPPQMKAFETLKTIMCRKPILHQPNYNDPFFLLTDASAYGVGAVLSQEGETNPHSKKTIFAPHRLLLFYLHPGGAKLRHLRERTPGGSQKPGTLEATPGSYGKTSHSADRPRQPSILEEPEKGEQEGSEMVRHPPRLSPPHQTCPGQATRRPRHAVQMPRHRQRGTRQPRPYPPTTGTLHPAHHRTKLGMGRTGKEHRPCPETAPTTYSEMEAQVRPHVAKVYHRPRPQTMARARKVCNPAERSTKKGNPIPQSWEADYRSPRTRPNNPKGRLSLLVARTERMGGELRKRMRPMPTKQDPHPQEEGPPVPHPGAPYGIPLPSSSHGPNHSAPEKRWLRRHLNHSRPRLHESGGLPPLFNNHNRRRSSKVVPGECLQMVRAAHQNHFGPRPPLHLPLCQGPLREITNQTEHLHGLPPPNRWPLRAEKSVDRTVPPPHHECAAG